MEDKIGEFCWWNGKKNTATKANDINFSLSKQNQITFLALGKCISIYVGVMCRQPWCQFEIHPISLCSNRMTLNFYIFFMYIHFTDDNIKCRCRCYSYIRSNNIEHLENAGRILILLINVFEHWKMKNLDQQWMEEWKEKWKSFHPLLISLHDLYRNFRFTDIIYFGIFPGIQHWMFTRSHKVQHTSKERT